MEKTVRGKKFSIWRPFLHLTKSHVKNYLVDNGLTWVDDPSNFSNQFDRNKIRNTILPNILSMRKGGMKGMLRSIENIRSSKYVMDIKMEECFKTVVCSDFNLTVQDEFLNVTVCSSRLLSESDPVIFELIRFWLRCAGLIAPPLVRLEEFVRQLKETDSKGRPELTLKGESDCYKMLWFKGKLWLEKK